MKTGHKSFFILGAPRSGTTLLETMLDQNSMIAVCPEMFSARTFWRLNAEEEIRDRWKNLIILNYFYNCTKHLDNPINFCLAHQALESFNYPISTRNWIDRLSQIYLRKTGARIFGEKTPENTFFIPTLSKIFPEKNYVIILRNPFDIILSLCEIAIIKLKVPIDNKLLLRFAEFVKRSLYELHVKRKEDTKSALWITYENLVSNTEVTLKSICQFLQVDYEDQMLKFQHQKKYISNHAIMKLVHGRLDQPITKNRVNRSLKELNNEQIAILYNFLTPEIHNLPYEYSINKVSLSLRNRMRIWLAKFCFRLRIYQLNEIRNKMRMQIHYYAIRFLHNTPLKSFLFKNLIYRKEKWEEIMERFNQSPAKKIM